MAQQNLDDAFLDPSADPDTNTDNNTPDTPVVVAYGRATSDTDQQTELTHALQYTRDECDRDNLTDDVIQGVLDGDLPDRLGVIGDAAGNYSGVEELRAYAAEHTVDHVVVTRLTQLSPSLRDVHDVISDLNEHGASVHSVEDALVIDPGDETAHNTLRAVAAGEKRAIRRKLPPVTVNTEPWTGRPPLGYEVVDGQLRPDDEYETVCDRLERVGNRDLSKRAAAEELDTTRRTITKCLEERREMYDLDE